MNLESKRENIKVLIFLIVIAVAVPGILGLILGWPGWLSVLLIAALLGIGALVRKKIIEFTKRQQWRREGQQWQREGFVHQQSTLFEQPQEEQQADQVPIANVALSSAVPGFEFLFSATVCWQRSHQARIPHANPEALAVETVLAHASEVAATESPSRYLAAQHRLASILGATLPDEYGHVQTWAVDVSLIIPEEDRKRLRQLSDVQQAEQVWAYECGLERSKRAYLREDVLKDTGSAVVWRLARHDEEIQRTVDLIGPLAQLSAAANNTEVSERYRHLVSSTSESEQPPGTAPFVPFGNGHSVHMGAFHNDDFPDAGLIPDYRKMAADHLRGLMDAIGLDSDDAQRDMFADRIAKIVESTGNPETAEEIRRAFDSSSPEATDPEAGDSGEPDEKSEAREESTPMDRREPGDAGEQPAAGSESPAPTEASDPPQ
jgi:hypothetical protein